MCCLTLTHRSHLNFQTCHFFFSLQSVETVSRVLPFFFLLNKTWLEEDHTRANAPWCEVNPKISFDMGDHSAKLDWSWDQRAFFGFNAPVELVKAAWSSLKACVKSRSVINVSKWKWSNRKRPVCAYASQAPSSDQEHSYIRLPSTTSNVFLISRCCGDTDKLPV